ncbi:glycerate kinase [Oculatella sp. LEGE 06141]|uniref:glycerate kinase n=1 Tax=Oculatella sp. LEGE 06141 TaxID=1828648 RepID=UPI00187E8BE9|nr:glycerate kinase [Oculatella sp. LEGE 06141]MBE9178401.1 glycerate kinase [Oculatella sp. LEGE 06141]
MPSLEQILEQIAAGQPLTPSVQQWLAERLLADTSTVQAFGLTPDTIAAELDERSRLLQQIYPDFIQLCQHMGWHHYPLPTLWKIWLPLACQLVRWQHPLQRPMIQGILGGQGTGKTTLAQILSLILRHLGLRICSLSIDDLYKTYTERLQLQQVDPRFCWRGPPGTHDVALGLSVLHQLRQADRLDPVALPRFDKSAWGGAGDRTQPELVQGADIVLFEGWFVGVRPVDPAVFATAPPPIQTEADRAFARTVNANLQDYQPLWHLLDRLIVLHPVDYRLSQQWRNQAEQQMMASGRAGMSEAEVDRFVEYFWRSLHPELFIAPMLHDAAHVNLVIEIQPDHTPGAVYRPG